MGRHAETLQRHPPETQLLLDNDAAKTRAPVLPKTSGRAQRSYFEKSAGEVNHPRPQKNVFDSAAPSTIRQWVAISLPEVIDLPHGSAGHNILEPLVLQLNMLIPSSPAPLGE